MWLEVTDRIVWEAPPPNGVNSVYEWFVEALKARPGEWARFPGAGHPVARGVWEGFEIVRRGKVVYMRYIGKAPERREAPSRPAPSLITRRPVVHQLPPLADALDEAEIRTRTRYAG